MNVYYSKVYSVGFSYNVYEIRPRPNKINNKTQSRKTPINFAYNNLSQNTIINSDESSIGGQIKFNYIWNVIRFVWLLDLAEYGHFFYNEIMNSEKFDIIYIAFRTLFCTKC